MLCVCLVPQFAVISESTVTQSLELDLFYLFNCGPIRWVYWFYLNWRFAVFSLPRTALLEVSWVQTAFLSIVNDINFSAAAVWSAHLYINMML